MVLMYPDAYDKLLKKVNSMSALVKSDVNDFERWMGIQQKIMENRLKKENQKSAVEEEESRVTQPLKKIKMEVEDSGYSSKPTRTVSTQFDPNMMRKMFQQRRSDGEVNDSLDDTFNSFSGEIFSPETPLAPKKANKKKKITRNEGPIAIKTVFSERMNAVELENKENKEKPAITSKMSTRSTVQNQKGKSIINWEMY